MRPSELRDEERSDGGFGGAWHGGDGDSGGGWNLAGVGSAVSEKGREEGGSVCWWLEMFDDDWGLESKEVSPLGEELSLFDRPNEVERRRNLEAHHLETVLQQQISQRMAPPHHDGRKAHLLEDKKIPSVGVFDEVYIAFRRYLEEIHMTWAHLEKKRTRLRSNTKTLQDLKSQRLETASPFIHDVVTLHLLTASQHFLTASAHTDSTRM
ncbi:hypothetical protein Tco_0001325 [Tanacetum coccineum]